MLRGLFWAAYLLSVTSPSVNVHVCSFVCSKLHVFIITVRYKVHHLLYRFKGAAVLLCGYVDISGMIRRLLGEDKTHQWWK